MALTAPPAKGYCAAADVAAFLGTTFTDAQTLQVNATIARAERFLDGQVNRSWLSGPVLGETFFAPYGLDPPSFFTSYVAGWVPLGSGLYLSTTPVQSVERVQGVGWLSTPPITLVRDLDYEVRDLTNGVVRVTVPSAYYKILVDYSPVDACPADITQATIALTATWLLPMLSPDSWLVDSVQLPDLTVKYARSSNTMTIPPDVQQIIESYRFRSVG